MIQHIGDWAVACPKCGAPPGLACTSIRHGGPLATSVYATHKKRRRALIMVALVLTGPPSAAEPRFSRSSSRRGQLP